MRIVVPLLAILLAPAATLWAQASKPCTIAGTVTAGATPVPGVAIVVTTAEGAAAAATSSLLDGRFAADVPGPGRYQVKADIATFAPVTREVIVGADCAARLDFSLTLASRTPRAATPGGTPVSPGQAAAPSGTVAAPPSPATTAQAPVRGARPGATAAKPAAALTGLFQRVTPMADAAAALSANAGAEDKQAVAEHLSLPPGFAADTLSQTIPAIGSGGQTNEALLMGGRLQGLLEGQGQGGAQGGAAARPGAGAGGGAPGGVAGLGDLGSLRELADMAGVNLSNLNTPAGVLAALGKLNTAVQSLTSRPRGMAAYEFGGSPLDAAPYSLNGRAAAKPDYLQQRLNLTMGGRLKIPNLFDAGPKVSFFLNYTATRSSNVYSQYSTVPSLAERSGDFSAVPAVIVDPVSRQAFAGNQIPDARISPVSRALMAYIPAPNQPGTNQNFYYSTTNRTSGDDVNFRFVRTFGGNTTPRRPGAAGAQGGGRGQAAGRGGAGAGGGLAGILGNLMPGLGGRGGGVNLNVGLHYHRGDNAQSNLFPALAGRTTQSGLDVPVNVSFPWRGLTNTFHVQYNRSHSVTTNAFASVLDVAGGAGIAGASTDPFDWGVPSLSFSSLTSLRDITPSERTDQTVVVSHGVVKTVGRHAIRFGGEFRDTRVDSRSDANPRGSFVFTGLYAGTDFADFLLGLPQQASLQYGPGLERFRTRSYAAYFQDDWRVGSTFTVNLGVRYEYQAPYWEAGNRLVNLDVAPGFTAAGPVVAGGIGPYHGLFPDTLVNPDRNNFAPRTGIAWRPKPNWMIRGGYGINYASVPYLSLVQRMAAQPPFASTGTFIGTPVRPLPIATALTTPVAADTTTNNFGVDPAYQVGYVHIWNADLQRDLGRTLSIGASYIGTKGSQLDLQRAPNRGPSGLRIAGVQPFIWESSGGRSIMHSLSVRIVRRLAQGLAGNATYTISTSRDNASSIGGGAAVVAQNDQDLEAEWGRSSFDQRHRFSATFSWELPLGTGRRWLGSGGGAANAIVGGWILSGNVAIASGIPLTARVLGDVADVARGTNGTLRANYSGAPIDVADPTVAHFFNTSAFTAPAPGTFGNAGRNTITGPGSAVLNASLAKSFSLAGMRGFSLRLQATNVLNTPQWAAIDTVVNSPSFGRVVGVRPMRSVQIVLRTMF